MPKFGQVAVRFLEEVVAAAAPRLFPGLEGENWMYRPEYEVPKVNEIHQMIGQLESETKSRIEEMHAEIGKLRAENADWYTLMTGTGDSLVAAVIRILKVLGFAEVIDVDDEIESGDDRTAMRREDVRIEDTSPILVVDVKGVQGHPEDSECQQAEKHALMRARDLERTDVQALTIINSQRSMPPQQRDQVAFREAIVKNAEETKSGLMTTWDLYIILRNARQNQWPSGMVKPIFYRVGRIETHPEHYSHIGSVVKVWKKRGAFGVISSEAVSVGDRLAVFVGFDYIELDVDSIAVDGVNVERAEIGSNCGVATDLADLVKEKCRVFRVAR
ncbi:hypothetical protein [Plesiocystis pacifica]|uniref:hypothetical protein n=1 Tax=Plesiocystis pacifica TaxID=191768 RepID=UPI0012FC5869|nr:hypothetical protein [Plesiocystis pacifica]